MKHFTDLFLALDQTTKTTVKTQALVQFFEDASDPDKVWAIALFSHRRPKRTVTTTLLREWAAEQAGIPLWLFEETYHVVGDLAETIAKVIPASDRKGENRSLSEWITYVNDLKELDENEKKERVVAAWDTLSQDERFLFNKLITGGFRVGVSQKLVAKALAAYTGKEASTIAHRLMGNWDPATVEFEELMFSDDPADDLSKPYPFYLAYPLEVDPDELGEPAEWAAEWKWDGIRGQLIRRGGELFLWSRGEELVTDKYPEFDCLREAPGPDFVIDGEILGYQDGLPLEFHLLQKRIGRKNVSRKTLNEVPVSLMAYDLLECDGVDLRPEPYVQRRAELAEVVEQLDVPETVMLSLREPFETWDALTALRAESRARRTEGFMLKRLDSDYKVGRKKGDWWKWKLEPMTVDAVMIYAMRGHGRRANLYTDFTFAVWQGENLVPFAKAYSGLTDQEFRAVSQFVKKNTVERFGPVRSVKPELVFELAFEGINRSTRHKSGIAVRFPRIKRWRKDKQAAEADHLSYLEGLLTL